MQLIETKVSAKYIGPEHPAFNPDDDYKLSIISQSKSPELEVTTKDGATSIMYPSKKKYLEHWNEIDGTKTIKPYRPHAAKLEGSKPKNVTAADAGAVIYTNIVQSINRFNAKSAHTYSEDLEYKKPEFAVRLQQEVYNEETQKHTSLYGAAILLLEIKQFGLKRIIYQEGMSFYTKKELDNVNAYAPKLYTDLFDSLVESALLYALALTPDDPDNVKAFEDAKEESNTTGTDSK